MRLGREADYSIPRSAAVDNRWSCTSSPPISHHGMQRDSFTLIFIFGSMNINPENSLSLQHNHTPQVCLSPLHNLRTSFGVNEACSCKGFDVISW
jgi:hypothetical protein